ncbi:alpha/beta hydrolase [Candidatus Bipolaricaulota bacterium]|nr:alpha/beta hydrolase [Candidatus Bipolaricaulota bacterium]
MQDMYVSVNRTQLRIRDYAQDGDAIIFLHFSGANLMMWRRAVPYFREGHRLILIDLPGHGKSDASASSYRIDGMARDVVGVMGHVGLDRAHIVGSSLGAEVGLSLAASFPDKAISLVCEGAPCSEYGPYSTWEGSESAFESHVAQQLEKMRSNPDTAFPSVDALVAARKETLERCGWWNEDVEAMVRYSARQSDDGTFGESFGRRALADYMEHYFRARFEDDYRRVRCPLLLALGESDLDDPRERVAIEGLCSLAKRGEIAEVDGWVHPYGWLLDPAPMCETILRFLTVSNSDRAGRSQLHS